MGTLILLLIIGFVIYLVIQRSAPEQPRPPQRSHPSRSQPPSTAAPGARTEQARSQLSGTAAATHESSTCWVPPGARTQVGTHEIAGGMLYVGERMEAIGGGGADPALINPRLQVSRVASDREGYNLPYWPSYSSIPPASRATYLAWLAAGRRDRSVGISYVFLFFYGIERRVLFDAQHLAEAREEVPTLLAEVEALLEAYGSNNSFRGYASRFLDFVRATTAKIEVARLTPPAEAEGWQIPFTVKVAIGNYVARNQPIPAEWALPWFRLHPETRLRTPGRRCPDQFARLFALRYRSEFGEGMLLKRNKTLLRLEYTPATASLRGRAVQMDVGDLPDVTRLSAPLTRLQKLAEKVEAELEPYSRWVGRTEDRTSPAALALLPAELVADSMGSETRELATWLASALGDEEIAIVEAEDLVARWPSKSSDKLTKKEATMLADLLGALGLGIEPDVRFGGTNLSRTGRVALFRLPAAKETADAGDLAAAAALLHLGAMVATADGVVAEDEEAQLEAHLEDALQLDGAARVRLRAHLRWLLACPPTTAGLKQKMATVAGEDRRRIGRVLLALAGADGHVSAEELKILGKVYPLLGLDPNDLYADVHDMAAGSERGPARVLTADAPVTGYAIPLPTREPTPAEAGVALDLERIAAIRAETVEVTKVLGGIFGEPDEPGTADAADNDEADWDRSEGGGGVAVTTLPGLDAPHSELVRALAGRLEISSAAFSALAEAHGLLPAGAVEVINEASFGACDEPMLEGSDPLEVNPYALEEMLA